jgi:UDP-N-acetylmuramoyl-L-alanyl-D-glutamate--2,6-diaminopimelate ligase
LNDAKAGFARPNSHAIIADRRQAIQIAIENARPHDIIVIAGKGHEDYQDIQGKKHPFDDRKVARQLLFQTKTARAQEREERDAEREAMQNQRGGFGPPPDRRF